MPVPTDFSIPYIDLELTTPDDIKIKAFLLLQRTVLNMGESPIEPGDGLPSDEEVRQILWEVGGYSSPRFAVCGLAANGAHVPRQRWEPRASHPIGQDLLWQDALQRHHAFISRARVFSHFLRPFPPAHILSVVMATLRARRPKRVRRQGPRFLSFAHCDAQTVLPLYLRRFASRCTDGPRLRSRPPNSLQNPNRASLCSSCLFLF